MLLAKKRVNKFLNFLIRAPIILLLVLVIAFSLFISIYKSSELGQTGDFFGGILNPVLGYITLIALIYTINLENQSLENTKESLKVTQDELKLVKDEVKISRETLDLTRDDIENSWP